MTNQLTYMERRGVEWPDYLYPVMGVLIGVLVTVPAIIVALVSYMAARVLLPIAFVVTGMSQEFGLLSFFFTCVQFPAYGLVVGLATMKSGWWGMCACSVLVLLHMAVVFVCFTSIH